MAKYHHLTRLLLKPSGLLNGASSSTFRFLTTPSVYLPSNIKFRPAVIRKPTPISSSETSSSPTTNSKQSQTPPLVLLFGWMSAKDTHLEKYRSFWTGRGYDVITVATEPAALVMPYTQKGTVSFNRQLVNFLADRSTPTYDRILLHNFSVGTYVSSIFRQQLNRAVDAGTPNAAQLKQALQGLVLDSVTFLEDSPRGTAMAATSSKPLQLLIQSVMISYYLLLLPFTLSQYLPVSRVLKTNQLPALFLYSLDDQLTSTRRIRNLISLWKRKGVDVREKCWTTSDHVQHFRIHNQEYVAEVERFLALIGMPH